MVNFGVKMGFLAILRDSVKFLSFCGGGGLEPFCALSKVGVDLASQVVWESRTPNPSPMCNSKQKAVKKPLFY